MFRMLNINKKKQKYTSLITRTEYKTNEGNKAVVHATFLAVFLSQSFLARFHAKKIQPMPNNKLMDWAINMLRPNNE